MFGWLVRTKPSRPLVNDGKYRGPSELWLEAPGPGSAWFGYDGWRDGDRSQRADDASRDWGCGSADASCASGE